MGNEGITRLAQVLQRRMRELNDKPPSLGFGVIQDNMSLQTDYFPLPIPQSDYMVCRSVSWGAEASVFCKTQYPGKENSGEHMHGEHGEHPHGTSGQHGGHDGGDGSHQHPDSEGAHTHPAGGGEMQHVHDVLVSSKFRSLQPGDRVLVAWIGNRACVIDLVFPATVIGIITYDINGGEGQGPSPQSFVLGESVTIQAPGNLSKSDAFFDGWKDSKTGVVYDEGSTAEFSADVTLIAQWMTLAGGRYFL